MVVTEVYNELIFLHAETCRIICTMGLNLMIKGIFMMDTHN